jgi:hypothetical protein
MPSPCARSAAACTLLLAACASLPPGAELAPFVREVELPPAVAAAVVGGALRRAMPFADPSPAVRGVLVSAPAADEWQVAFTRVGDVWLPLGTHRLALRIANDEAASLEVAREALAHAASTARAAWAGGFRLHVQATPHGTRIAGEMPAAMVRRLDDALALAHDPAAARPGLDEPNLAAWAAHRLLAAAHAADVAGDRDRAHARRQAASRLGCGNYALHARLAADAERRGEARLAVQHGWQAVLACDDLVRRGELARQLDRIRQRGTDPVAWRTAARQRMHESDAELAAHLLHTARRLQHEPTADYRLLSRTHRLRDDDDAAHATALLAREHAGSAIDVKSLVAELWSGLASPTAAAAPLR